MPQIPMRSDQLARERSRKGGNRLADVTKGTMRPVGAIQPDDGWHQVAKMLWDGALSSGQSDFYQNSDLAQLYMLCCEVNQYIRSEGFYIDRTGPGGKPVLDENGEPVRIWTTPRRNAQWLSVINSMMADLMFSEGARRKARLELEQSGDEDQEATVASIMDAQRAALMRKKKASGR